MRNGYDVSRELETIRRCRAGARHHAGIGMAFRFVLAARRLATALHESARPCVFPPRRMLPDSRVIYFST